MKTVMKRGKDMLYNIDIYNITDNYMYIAVETSTRIGWWMEWKRISVNEMMIMMRIGCFSSLC